MRLARRISVRNLVLSRNIQSAKHVKAKKAILDSKKKDQSILDLIKRNDQAKHPKGETLSLDMRLYRFELVECFLAAGIPLSKIDCLRSFLEKYGHRLTSDSHLRELVPSVVTKEKDAEIRTISGEGRFNHL